MSLEKVVVGEARSSRPLAGNGRKGEQKHAHEMGNRKAHKNKFNTST